MTNPLRGLLVAMLIGMAGTNAYADEPFSVHELPNGLTVLAAPSSEHPVIALSCFVTTGGRTEDEYYQGSLHYIEHLVFKGGTPNLEPTQFRKKMSTLGRESGGWTWDDEINFGFEVPKENFVEALTTFREALLDLQFEEQWFEDEKLVVIQEMTRGFEQPGRLIYNFWDELAYLVHPYGRPVIGSEKAVLELEMNKTEQYYRDRFSPNHIILSLAGDFETEEILDQIRSTWGSMERGPASFELGLEEKPQTGPRTRVDHLKVATTGVFLTGLVTPGGSHEDTVALEMLAALLNNRSYGLPQFLEEQEKWVSSISAYHYPMQDYGNFQVSCRLDPDDLESVCEFVNAFLMSFDATRIPETVFAEVRQALAFSEAQQRLSASDRASRYGFLTSRRGSQAAQDLLNTYDALTAEQVQAAKERWFDDRRLVTAKIFPDDFVPPKEPRKVVPRAPAATSTPSLEIAGALLAPEETDALPFEKVEETAGVHLYHFENGLRLAVRPSKSSELMAMTARVLGGQWVEKVGEEGVNRFVSEVGMASTRRWNAEEFDRLLTSLSIEAGAHASVGSRANTSRNVDYRDSAAHHVLGLDRRWASMLAILKETIFFPDFESPKVDKIREDLLTEIRSLREDNLEYIKQEFYIQAYPGHPYGRPTVGTEDSIASLSREKLKAFHTANWSPDRVVVTVVGNADPDEVATTIARNWADVPRAPRGPWSIDPEQWNSEWKPSSETHVVELGKDYWTVNWGRAGTSYLSDSFYPSVVLSRLAGNDHFYKYVYGEGVSYRSWIRFWEQLGPGAWIIENDVKRDRFDEILGMFDEDLVRYSTEGFSREEFDESIQRLVNSTVLDEQDPALLAWRLAVALGNGAGISRVTGRTDALRGVTHEDVLKLASETFQPESILRVIQQ